MAIKVTVGHRVEGAGAAVVLTATVVTDSPYRAENTLRHGYIDQSVNVV